MRHSLEPEYREYVKRYRFLSFARNFGDKYGRKLMNTAIKTGTNFNSKHGKKLTDTAIKKGKDFATIAGKKIIHESAEATGDLVGNKIADKITSMGKPRSKKEKDETNIMEETQEIYIPPEKRNQIIKDLKIKQEVFISLKEMNHQMIMQMLLMIQQVWCTNQNLLKELMIIMLIM